MRTATNRSICSLLLYAAVIKREQLIMASSNIASALTVLTGEQYTPSDFADNCALEALVTEYFTGSDEITDNENSDNSEGVANRVLAFVT